MGSTIMLTETRISLYTRVPLNNGTPAIIPVFALGQALSLFLAISYVLCILGYLIWPGLPINHAVLALVLPGFSLLSWSTFFIGLIETYAYGWYVALIFGPLYNFFVSSRTKM
jgi:hypothetical protein